MTGPFQPRQVPGSNTRRRRTDPACVPALPTPPKRLASRVCPPMPRRNVRSTIYQIAVPGQQVTIVGVDL